MEPIADLTALRPVLASLKAKGLVVPLTPEGRGHVVTHALYPPREWERVQAKFAGYVAPAAGDDEEEPARQAPPQWHGPTPTPPAPHAAATGPQRVAEHAGPSNCAELDERCDQLREELQLEINVLREEVAELRAALNQVRDESDRLRRELGVV